MGDQPSASPSTLLCPPALPSHLYFLWFYYCLSFTLPLTFSSLFFSCFSLVLPSSLIFPFPSLFLAFSFSCSFSFPPLLLSFPFTLPYCSCSYSFSLFFPQSSLCFSSSFYVPAFPFSYFSPHTLLPLLLPFKLEEHEERRRGSVWEWRSVRE